MAKTLYRNGSVYSSADPFATSVLIDGDTVAWLGGEEAADRHVQSADEVIDLKGALMTPAFVESHTHLAALGRTLSGADLSSAKSSTELLQLVSLRAQSTTGLVLAQGWDDTAWEHPQLPSEADLTAAANGRGYYLPRVDVHSALVNREMLDQLGLGALSSGLIHGNDHDQVREALASLNLDEQDYQLLALQHYASNGYGTVVEMAAPQLEGRTALDSLLELDSAELPKVYAFWGELVQDQETAAARMAEFPAGRVLGLGGDLRVDGSLGSHTAYLREDYADQPGNRGTLFLSVEQIASHLTACSSAGIQAAFHVIGDAAMDTVLDAFDMAAEQVGVAKLQMCRHRIEHAEMVDDENRARLLKYSIMVSMQPAFDEAWGGEDGMYENRLGPRATQMNNLSAMLSSGVPLVLGSDAPVTDVDGWGIVRAAMKMNHPEARISARAAFLAQTRSTYRAMGVVNPTAGQLVIGAEATFAIWSASELAVQTPDVRISSWSTDARAGTPMLPVVDEEIPSCLRTVRAGNILFDRLDSE